MLLVKSFKKTFRKVSLTRCLPTTLASWSARNFSRSALSLSTTEAGPACFFRKPTIPSAKRSSEVRRMQKDNEEPQDQSPAHLYTDLRCKQTEWVGDVAKRSIHISCGRKLAGFILKVHLNRVRTLCSFVYEVPVVWILCWKFRHC